MNTRRIFLRNSALAMVGVGAAPMWLQRALYAEPANAMRRKKVLVAIFQRGAADGLNIVAPHGEKRYYDLRPTIAIPRPDSTNANASAIDLDGMFGLHPSLAPLKALYDDKHLAIVQAAGSPDPTRSHFDAQDYMESGTPGMKSTKDGWMNRALAASQGKVSPVRALSLGSALPRSLRGPNPAIAIQSVPDFQVKNATASSAFEKLYLDTADKTLHNTGRDTFDAVSLVRAIQQQPYSPAGGAEYPRGRFGESLKQIAQLIKSDVGVEFAFAEIGGWDHHVNEVGPTVTQGPLANLLTEFGRSLAAFWKDLGDRMEDVVVVTMSEFGRTAKENGNRGTDHGHANCMFVMGGPVKGGRVYGDWPGLAHEQLFENRDLSVTTDFRDVLGELVYSHMGNQNLAPVFPGYALNTTRFRGIVYDKA
jgi:uncharacterized protein (DUF1501 family)